MSEDVRWRWIWGSMWAGGIGLGLALNIWG